MKPAAHCHFQASDPLRTVTLVWDVIRMERLGPGTDLDILVAYRPKSGRSRYPKHRSFAVARSRRSMESC